MMAMIVASMTSSLQASMTDPDHSVWEVFCSPKSWLSEACRLQDLNPFRVNSANDFYVNKDETYERMWTLYKQLKPKKHVMHSLVSLAVHQLRRRSI